MKKEKLPRKNSIKPAVFVSLVFGSPLVNAQISERVKAIDVLYRDLSRDMSEELCRSPRVAPDSNDQPQ